MAYCTNAQVAAEFKGLTFSSTSTPTDTTVDRFIAEADAEINARVGLKYEVPLTGAVGIIIARMLSIGLVAERVRQIVRVKTGAEPTKSDGSYGLTGKEVREKIEQIVNNLFIISDATSSNPDNGMSSYTVDNATTATFGFDEGDQW